MICGIYKITSPTGRIYIGQSIDIKRRLYAYIGVYKSCKTSVKLYRSLLKYGFTNHKFEIVEKCERSQLNDRERYWQDFYNSASPKHLNCLLTKTDTKPGKSKPISEEHKRMISKVHKGKVLSKETIEKLKIARAKQVITEEHKRKISENSGSARIVLDTQTGIFYRTIKEAAYAKGLKPNTLCCMLLGKQYNKSSLIYA